MTEYSSMKFAWFFLAEYINMLNVSAVAVTLFLGGWRAPVPLSLINDGMLNTGWWPILWFLAKVWLLMFVFVWVRGTLLRLRYDQFMVFGWKVLIPVALGWLVLLSVLQYVRLDSGVGQGTLVTVLVVAGLVAVVLLTFWPEKAKPDDDEAAPTTFDAFAGGYPVPPLPGQALPPSPRAARRPVTVDAVSSEEEATR
jgi:NADH-quinone oxidoreductase subunit H